jgi:hypothetical protein
MGGIQFVVRTGGFQDPRREEKLLSNSIAAASATNPALFSGDFVVLTTVAALTGAAPNNGPVLRRLSVADRTANYLQTNPAGIFAVIFDNIITNATGQVTGSPWSGSPPGNAILNMPNEAASASFDPVTGRSRANVFVVDPTMLFMARIHVNTTDFAAGLTLGHQYDGLRCGINMTANGNQGIFTLRPAAAAADQILIIHRPNEQDPNYGKTVLGTDTFANNALADARSGPTVIFSVREEYCQVLNGVMYTTNSGGTI